MTKYILVKMTYFSVAVFMLMHQFHLGVAQAQTRTEQNEGDLIRLVAGLDEPEEYYCFDLAGWGDHVKLNDPLQTHTCKKTGAEDQMFDFESGRLKVSDYNLCVQAAGSSGKTIPGSAILARDCSDNKLQMFTMVADGRIRLDNTDLCIGAGKTSLATSGPSHMWRTLSIVTCDFDEQFTQWQTGM